jgi:pimeloyl-ACP methyl ester carboxylesterase
VAAKSGSAIAWIKAATQPDHLASTTKIVRSTHVRADPVVILVHGAFTESANRNGVIEHLHTNGVDALAFANPLRSVRNDATYLRAVIARLDRLVLLVGHSYGGIVITGAAGAANPAVVGLVYVAAFAPDEKESAFERSSRHPGSTLGEALTRIPLSTRGDELVIRRRWIRGSRWWSPVRSSAGRAHWCRPSRNR